jgi:hypothetical protein
VITHYFCGRDRLADTAGRIASDSERRRVVRGRAALLPTTGRRAVDLLLILLGDLKGLNRSR